MIDARGRESFNTLARWFYYALKKPQQESDSSDDSDVDSDEMHLEDDAFLDLLGQNEDADDVDMLGDEDRTNKLVPSSSIVESRVADALEDLKHGTKLSVAVTGSRGAGKSLLINTLLEATTSAAYQHETDSLSSMNNTSTDTPASASMRHSSAGYTFESADTPKDDSMDVDVRSAHCMSS